MAERRITVRGAEMEFQDDGTVVLRQEQGEQQHWVELHPTLVRALCEQVDRSFTRRLLLITDRMDDLQRELRALDVQTYSQPWEAGKVIVDDLQNLLEDLGVPSDIAHREAESSSARVAAAPAPAPGAEQLELTPSRSAG